MTPVITASYLDSDILWVHPTGANFNGKAPAYTNFDTTGQYRIKVLNDNWDATTVWDFSGCPINGSVSSWNTSTGLTTIGLQSTSLSGDISAWSLAALESLYFNDSNIDFNLSSFSIPSTLTKLYMNQDATATSDISAASWDQTLDIQGKITYPGATSQTINWSTVGLSNLTEVANKSAGTITRHNPWDFSTNQTFYNLSLQSGDIDFNGYTASANYIYVSGGGINVDSGTLNFTQMTLATDKVLTVGDGEAIAQGFTGQNDSWTGYLVLPSSIPPSTGVSLELINAANTGNPQLEGTQIIYIDGVYVYQSVTGDATVPDTGVLNTLLENNGSINYNSYYRN